MIMYFQSMSNYDNSSYFDEYEISILLIETSCLLLTSKKNIKSSAESSHVGLTQITSINYYCILLQFREVHLV